MFQNTISQNTNKQSETHIPPTDGCANAPDLLNGLSERRTYEYANMMLDSAPFGVILWDENFNIIEANQAVVTFYGIKDEYDLQVRIFDCIPEFQPDGSRSDEQVRHWISKAFTEGHCINNIVREMPETEQIALTPQGVMRMHTFLPVTGKVLMPV